MILSEILTDLSDCTGREVALLGAALRLGGGKLPLRVVDKDARPQLEARVEALSELDDEERAMLEEEWIDVGARSFEQVIAALDVETHAVELTPEWRTALYQALERERVGVGFGDQRVSRLVRWLAIDGAPERTALEVAKGSPLWDLLQIGEDQRDAWLTARGAAILGVLSTEIGRRKLARIARLLPEHREAITRVAGGALEVSEDFRKRVLELFVALSEKTTIEDEAHRIGLYLVALAAGQRWNDDVARVADRLGTKEARLLREYHASVKRSSRAQLEGEARTVLEALEAVCD